MYQSNDPQLFRQIFQEGFTCAYPRVKAALQEGRYCVAPDLDRATRFWLFNDYWTIRYAELTSSAVIGLASQADRQVSVG